MKVASTIRRRSARAALGLALLALAALPPAARAEGGGRHGPPPIDRVLERHAGELGLSEALLARVRAIGAAAREEEQPLVETLDAEREALHALLGEDAPDLDAVMQQVEVIGAAETALHQQRLRTLLTVRALLTPEQRAQLVEIFEERRARKKARWRERREAE